MSQLWLQPAREAFNCLSTSYVVDKENSRTIYYRTPVASLLQLIANLIKTGRKEKYGLRCTCLQCGNEWYTKRAALYSRYNEIVSKVLGPHSAMDFAGIEDTYLRLGENQVMIYLSEKKGCIVPYDELEIVSHRESIPPFYGRLSIRDRARRKKPLPKTLNAAKNDSLTILYAPDNLEQYQQVYAALRAIVEVNRGTQIV